MLYCDHAFHGLTVGSLSVNGSAEFKTGFGPLRDSTGIPFGDTRRRWPPNWTRATWRR